MVVMPCIFLRVWERFLHKCWHAKYVKYIGVKIFVSRYFPLTLSWHLFSSIFVHLIVVTFLEGILHTKLGKSTPSMLGEILAYHNDFDDWENLEFLRRISSLAKMECCSLNLAILSWITHANAKIVLDITWLAWTSPTIFAYMCRWCHLHARWCGHVLHGLDAF